MVVQRCRTPIPGPVVDICGLGTAPEQFIVVVEREHAASTLHRSCNGLALATLLYLTGRCTVSPASRNIGTLRIHLGGAPSISASGASSAGVVSSTMEDEGENTGSLRGRAVGCPTIFSLFFCLFSPRENLISITITSCQDLIFSSLHH